MRDQYKNSAKWYDRIIEPLISGLKATGLEIYPVNEDMAVLDIGCGTGSFLTCYKKYTSKIFGIDLSPSMINIASKKLGEEANLSIGSATNMDFKNDQFDLITCSLILHEVPQKVRLDILKEAKRVLRNEGRILLIDYHPGPINKAKGLYSKLIINLIEFLAGREHYTNYCHFIKNGGLPSLIDLLELKVENQKILSGGNFGIFILSK